MAAWRCQGGAHFTHHYHPPPGVPTLLHHCSPRLAGTFLVLIMAPPPPPPPPDAKVTYKERISYSGGPTEAEWAPIERLSQTMGDGSVQERNVTQARGVEFMSRPPDLRQEPSREAFSKGEADKETGEPEIPAPRTKVDKMLKAWGPQLSSKAWSHWLSLRSMFKSYAAEQSNLPTSVDVSFDAHDRYIALLDKAAGGATADREKGALAAFDVGAHDDTRETEAGANTFTFKGAPMQLLPILKQMMRYPRPLIHHDPFQDEAPQEFPAVVRAGQPAANPIAADTADTADPQDGLRHPGTVNAVIHNLNTERDLAALDWLERQPNRLSAVVKEGLYIVQMHGNDIKGELLVGLCYYAGKTEHDSEESDNSGGECATMDVKWFERKGVKSFHWAATPTFEQTYFDKDGWMTYQVGADSFLLKLEDYDLTEAAQAKPYEEPRLTSAFMGRVKAFCTKHSLVRTESESGDGGGARGARGGARSARGGGIRGARGGAGVNGGADGGGRGRSAAAPSGSSSPRRGRGEVRGRSSARGGARGGGTRGARGGAGVSGGADGGGRGRSAAAPSGSSNPRRGRGEVRGRSSGDDSGDDSGDGRRRQDTRRRDTSAADKKRAARNKPRAAEGKHKKSKASTAAPTAPVSARASTTSRVGKSRAAGGS